MQYFCNDFTFIMLKRNLEYMYINKVSILCDRKYTLIKQNIYRDTIPNIEINSITVSAYMYFIRVILTRPKDWQESENWIV